MGKYWHNVNQGLSPQDPDFDHDYDLDEDYERYLAAMEEQGDSERENK